MSVITKKICLLGDFNVGKTSLVRRFVEDKFSDQYLSTVGVKVSRKTVNLKTDLELHQVNLLVWDLEGNTKFKSITPSYLKGASGSIIVADLSRPNTLNNLKQHVKLFVDVNPQGAIIIALNKADLIPQEKLNKLIENYSSYSSQRIVGIYATSAKTGEKVAEMFDELSNVITLNS
ncbi:GTP-binding protein [Pleurocapsales cyanobacterium LEGE 10410]|nr:GTP-binding protein [Pleurocapsales cyanobacterium LEGE 10410]